MRPVSVRHSLPLHAGRRPTLTAVAEQDTLGKFREVAELMAGPAEGSITCRA